MGRRIAIVGTAASWTLAPFQTPEVEIWSLNDAYRMKGWVRADRWYDFHPLNRFHFSEDGKPLYAHQVPPGYYARPTEHLDWLASRTIPIYLNPGYAEQHPPAAAWAHAHPFPKLAIEPVYGNYFTSSPAWMLAHALSEGVRDIEIYGIHLATESEYIEQRPNFEFLIGCLLGSRSPRTLTVTEGKRIYETVDGRVVLPVASPILQSNFQYAFEPRPRAKLDGLKWDVHRHSIKRERAVQTLRDRRWWQPSAPAQTALRESELYLADAQERLQAAQLVAQE